MYGIKKIKENEYEVEGLWSVFPNKRAYGGHIIAKIIEIIFDYQKNILPDSINIIFHKPVSVLENLYFKLENIKFGKCLHANRFTGFQNEKIVCTAEILSEIVSANLNKNNKIYENTNFDLKKLQETEFIKIDFFLKHLNIEQTKCLEPFIEKFDIEINKPKDNLRIVKFHLKEDYSNIANKYTIIGFISDMFLIESSCIPLNINLFSPKIQLMTSIDHKIYFHSANFKSELIFTSECLIINNSKVLCIGKIFNENLDLLSTVIQEGLIKIE